MEKKLYRSNKNKMICGVCGGLAEYINLDATILRLIVAILAFGSCGTAALIYLVASLIIPVDPTV